MNYILSFLHVVFVPESAWVCVCVCVFRLSFHSIIHEIKNLVSVLLREAEPVVGVCVCVCVYF